MTETLPHTGAQWLVTQCIIFNHNHTFNVLQILHIAVKLVSFAEVRIKVSISSIDTKVDVNVRSTPESHLEMGMAASLGFKNLVEHFPGSAIGMMTKQLLSQPPASPS